MSDKVRCSGGVGEICTGRHVKGGTSLIQAIRRRGSQEVEPSRTTAVITSALFDQEGGGGMIATSTLLSAEFRLPDMRPTCGLLEICSGVEKAIVLVDLMKPGGRHRNRENGPSMSE